MKCQKLLCIFPLVHLNTVLCAIKCPTHVSGYHGTEGIISCFISEFHNVYWFEEADETLPLIRLEDGGKSGRGLDNGEYDILEDGSLVIKNITFSNNQQYEIKVIDTEDVTEIFINFSVSGCARICPPGNGQVNQNASFAQFICDDGFHLDRQHSSTLQCKCESGATNSCSWSGLPPTCVATIFVHEPSITDINAFSTPLDVTSQHTSKVTEQPMTIADESLHRSGDVCMNAAAFAVTVAVGTLIICSLVATLIYCIAKNKEKTNSRNPSTSENNSASRRNTEDDTDTGIAGDAVNDNPRDSMEVNSGQINGTNSPSEGADKGKKYIEMKANEQTESHESSTLLQQ